MPTRSVQTKDPISDAPLREPGQSIREELDNLLMDSAAPWLMTALLVIVIAGLEWWSWWFSLGRSPILFSVAAIGVTAIAAWKIRNFKAAAKLIKIGLKGERATGQLLQSGLMPMGYQVFHDCCFEGYNVDHVIIGPGGVFAIETKTRFKPVGDARVTYDGNLVRVNGHVPDRDPVVQARAGAARIRDILAEFTGISMSVKPVVLFPGWFVEGQSSRSEAWVLNPKAFVTWVGNEPERLSSQQVRVLAGGLARYVRSKLDS